MCAGYESTSGACLETGVVYKFEVSLPEDHFQPSSTLGATDTISRAIGQIGWSICGETGGVPANMNFKLLSPDDAAQSKRKCEIVCDTSIFEIELTSKAIIDSTGEIPHGLSVGWGGGYYSLYHESTGLMYAGGTLLAFQKPMTHRVCLPQSIFSVDPSASNIKSSSSGKVIVIFSDGSIWDGGTGDPSRMWSTCGVTQILTTDFSFFQATLEPFVGCQLLPPPLLHDKTVSRVIISDEALSPLRVGVFSTYSHSSGSSYNTSRWFGKEYVISSIEVEDRMIETAVSNGSISSLASAAQFAHPLKGLKEWVLRVKAKAAIVSPPASSSITPTLPFSHGLSESASFLFVPTLGFPTPSAQHTEADQPNFFNVALSTEQAVLPLLLHPELLSAISSLNKTSDASVSFNSDDDNGNLLSNVRAKEAAAVRSSMLFSTSSNLHSAVASEDKRTQERPFWMSCGVKGKMDEYYKFHRADTAIGCERSCLMLNSTADKTDTKGRMKDNMLVDFETDMALAFFTKADDFGELEALRRLTSRNFICMGNKTSADDKQCFRIILGGGTNIVDPIWQFCSLSTVSVTAVVEFCVTDWTECTAKIIDQPKCASEDFPPALLPPGDTTPSAPEAETLIKSSGPLIGMYILLYDEKGYGWSEAEYVIIYVPVSLNNLLSSVVSPILQKSVRNTIRDVDDGVDSNTSSLPLGQILVKQGALAVGKQTGYASICVANGCYTADVTLGNEPEQIAWVLCGMIGSAGMNVVFGVKY